MENGAHIFNSFKCVPWCLLKFVVGKKLRSMLKPKFFSEAFIEAAVHYWALTTQNLGKQDCVMTRVSLYFAYLHNHLFTDEKML
mmetsp:Transcript_29577/g.39337  ORF Transcript_29577/g.39337 Transcript_29577/m.39337 type:complete len:84 (-) Transcript_29577:37-288(-)